MVDNYAFIDSQNLNLAVLSMGWKLDFKRFRTYLKEKYCVKKAFLFIGYVASNQKLYDFLTQAGYVLVFKPVVIGEKNKMKGNVDAELVLHSMIEFSNYSKAVIVSGDGDFHCLIEYLYSQNKLSRIIVPNRKKYSSLLRKFNNQITFVSDIYKKADLEQKERH